ncbi:MAG: hypothetical protein WBM32_22955 [Crocosphaera sp.]
MHSIIHKTFGGLTFQYYFRQLVFSVILAMIWAMVNEEKSIILWAYALANTFLYPYSRFIYESIIDFIIGDNIFIISGILLLTVKFFTMFLCWLLSLLIAPIGLIFLYFYHSRTQKMK